MKLPYAFYINSDGGVAIDQEKDNIVRQIYRLYRQYLSGMSLGGIVDFLFEQGVSSPRGKERWTQPVISALLSNKKYISAVVTLDEYLVVPAGACWSVCAPNDGCSRFTIDFCPDL